MTTHISGLSITDVRRFANHHHVPLSRVNLLVGRNSAAKTTFLACAHSILRQADISSKKEADIKESFNSNVFNIKSFADISRNATDTFRVAVDLSHCSWQRFELELTEDQDKSFKQNSLTVQLSSSANANEDSVKIEKCNTATRDIWRFIGPNFDISFDKSHFSDTQISTWLSRYSKYRILPFEGDTARFQKQYSVASVEEYAKFVNFLRLNFQFPPSIPKVIALKPHELTPQRSFEIYRLLSSSGSIDLEAISEYGRKLGIFNQLQIKTLDDKVEVLVDVDGTVRNLANTGHGISSIIPFLVELADTHAESLLLLQQPEVHLHPSAQASLVRLISQSASAFMIETHSDHLIDWFRIMVKQNRMDHADVKVLYFETSGDTSTIHVISVDQNGNLVDVPKDYRDFFLDERNKLLGFND